MTALVLHDLFGGDLVLGEVHVAGQRTGVHYWNRFGAGLEVDLTRDQFHADEHVVGARVLQRPDGPPNRCRAEYDLLRTRVMHRMATTPSARQTSPASHG